MQARISARLAVAAFASLASWGIARPALAAQVPPPPTLFLASASTSSKPLPASAPSMTASSSAAQVPAQATFSAPPDVFSAIASASLSLDRVAGLAREALLDIADGRREFGGLTGFAGDYADGIRGVLNALFDEWVMGSKMAAIVKNAHTDRLVAIRDLLVTQRQGEADTMDDAEQMSDALERTTNAIAFRQQQIILYGALCKGLTHDQDIYQRVLAVVRRQPASASVSPT